MLNGSKKVPSKPGAKVQRIIDLHQQAILAASIVPYSIGACESQGTLIKDVGSD